MKAGHAIIMACDILRGLPVQALRVPKTHQWQSDRDSSKQALVFDLILLSSSFDPLTIPYVVQVPLLAGIGENRWLERRDAFAANVNRTLYPFIGSLFTGDQELKPPVDAQNVGNAFQRIFWRNCVLVFPPLEEG